jgi:hypothetical protein
MKRFEILSFDENLVDFLGSDEEEFALPQLLAAFAVNEVEKL